MQALALTAEAARAEVITFTVALKLVSEVLERIRKVNVILRRHGDEVVILTQVRGERRHPVFEERTTPTMTFTVATPAIGGEQAKLIGSFELAEDGVSLYKHALGTATPADLEPFVARWQDCDHCNYNRNRKASFVCERADGSRVIIGRTCSQAYIGLTPEQIAGRIKAFEKLKNISDEELEFDRTSGDGDRVHTLTLVEACYKVAQEHGGYNKDMRETLSFDANALLGNRGQEAAERRAYYASKTWKEIDYPALLTYVEGSNGDFAENLRIALGCEYVKPKRFGIILAGVGLFVGRAMKRAKEEARLADLPPAKHLDAPVGARIDFLATVERTFPFSNDFGGGVIVVMRCKDGSCVVHKATGAAKAEAEKTYKVRATVKEHGTYQRTGDPQTKVSRAVYVEQI